MGGSFGFEILIVNENFDPFKILKWVFHCLFTYFIPNNYIYIYLYSFTYTLLQQQQQQNPN